MSLPKDKLHELIERLNDKDAENLIDITEALIIKREKEAQKGQEFDPEEYRGVLNHLNIDVERESKKLREQWKRDIC